MFGSRVEESTKSAEYMNFATRHWRTLMAERDGLLNENAVKNLPAPRRRDKTDLIVF